MGTKRVNKGEKEEEKKTGASRRVLSGYDARFTYYEKESKI